jgi:hypothetical protein
MAEHHPSPSSLFNQLTSFSYAHDPDFALGASDAMQIERSTQVSTASLRDNDTGEEIPLYDEKKILFRAERDHTEEDFRDPSQPSTFAIQQEIITQLPGIPGTLREQLGYEAQDGGDWFESSDFNKVQYVHYGVKREDDGEITIDRNIGYMLRDYENILYETSEIIGQPAPEYIPIAHRQQTLRVFSPIKQEAAEDEIEQVSYNAIFDEIFDGVSNMRFFHELVQTREADATISILGLVECLKRRWVVPDQLLLSKEHLNE